VPEQQTLDSQKNSAINIVIGTIEMLGGIAFAGGGIAAAAALAPETIGSSAMVGYGGIVTGSTLFAFGLGRVSGAYNGSLLDDLEALLISPLGAAIQGINKQ
jgi:hypothetical protein